MRSKTIASLWIGLMLALSMHAAAQQPDRLSPARWTEKAANDWYGQQPWLVGSNYIPASAINELEMWQADTFDPQRIIPHKN